MDVATFRVEHIIQYHGVGVKKGKKLSLVEGMEAGMLWFLPKIEILSVLRRKIVETFTCLHLSL